MKKLIVFVAVGLFVWFGVSELRIVSPGILPKPLSVLDSFRTSLLIGAVSTTVRAIAGFFAGLFLSYSVHFLCVFARIDASMDTQFAGARAVPIFAVLPLFVIWFGFSEVGRILVVSLSAMAFFIAPLHEAFKRLAREWTLLRDQLRLSILSFYWHIVIPGTIGLLLGPLRVTFAVAFTISIASEYVGAQVGIGRFLDSARVTFNVPAIFLGILTASIIGVSIDRLITSYFESKVHWLGKDAKA